MKMLKLTKIISSLLAIALSLALNPTSANASWKHNNKGWWYTVDSAATGWMEIDGDWYYFLSDGYMAHDTIIDGFKLGSNGVYMPNQESSKASNFDVKIDEVTVETAQEFVNAIGSNKRILMKPGVYNLSSIDPINKSDNSVVWNTVYDGNELNIQDVHNLTIEGIDSGKVEIKVVPRYANILNFTNASNITIKNIIAGHTPSSYKCDAGVFNFSNSNSISILNSELYGCGSIGLSLSNVKKLDASNCTIDHCSLRAIQIYNSEAITFTENKIINHEAYSNIIMINGSNNITFEKCDITDNHNFTWSFIEALDNSNVVLDKCVIKNNSKGASQTLQSDKVYFFNTTDYSGINNSKITIKNSEISGNKFDYLQSNEDSVKFENCTTNNNIWK